MKQNKDKPPEGIGEDSSSNELWCEGSEKVETAKGSGVPVWKIVKLHLSGSSKEEILEKFPSLEENNVRGAISYYYCNRRRIERQLEDNAVDDKELGGKR